jgi:hypothetical protein
MKKIIAVLSFSIFSIFANAQYANTKIQVGQKAPALEFPNPDGTVLKLSDIISITPYEIVPISDTSNFKLLNEISILTIVQI